MSGKKWRTFIVKKEWVPTAWNDDGRVTHREGVQVAEGYCVDEPVEVIDKAALEEKDRVIRELEKEQAEHIEILAAEYDRKFKEKEAVIQELVARLRDARQWVAIQAAISESKTIKDDLILIEQVIEKHSKGASEK